MTEAGPSGPLRARESLTKADGPACPAAEVGPGWDCHVHVFDGAAPVRVGHYLPAHRPLAQIEAEAARHGVGHLVLVQPSVYGSDNSLLLDALRVEPGRHRGVIVLGDGWDEAMLDEMHQAGVRGARLNRVSPIGEATDIAARYAALAPALVARGWHLQWYAQPEHLAQIAALHLQPGAPVCMLDHLAGLHAGLGLDAPAWQALKVLAAMGAWVKLSGWYRLGAAEPYDALVPIIQRVATMFEGRTVWGSDWPHTSFEDRLPRYASTWEPVVTALGAAAAIMLRNTVPALYR